MVNSHKGETLNHFTIKYILCICFTFHLSSALVKTEREVLLKLTNLTYLSVMLNGRFAEAPFIP